MTHFHSQYCISLHHQGPEFYDPRVRFRDIVLLGFSILIKTCLIEQKLSMKGEVQLQPPAVMQNPSDSDPLLHNRRKRMGLREALVRSRMRKKTLRLDYSPVVEFASKAIPTQVKTPAKDFKFMPNFLIFWVELLNCEIWAFPCKII